MHVEGDTILSTDTVITEASSSAEVRFADGANVALSPESRLEIRDFAFGEGVEPSFVLNLANGAMRSVSGEVVRQNPEAFKILTPKATMGIRGTETFTAVHGDQEVHAVLAIGKSHIVVITGPAGLSPSGQALQGVTVDGQTLSRRAYTATELEAVVRQLAPALLQTPLPTPGEAMTLEEGQRTLTTSVGLTVLLLVEAQQVLAGQTAAQNPQDLSVLRQLGGLLQDAGFAVQVAEAHVSTAVPVMDPVLVQMMPMESAASAPGASGMVTDPVRPSMPPTPSDPSGPSTPPDPGTPPLCHQSTLP